MAVSQLDPELGLFIALPWLPSELQRVLLSTSIFLLLHSEARLVRVSETNSKELFA